MTPSAVHPLEDELEPVPPAAAAVFGPRLATAVEYARLLGSVGVQRGLLGPREPGRIWSRHLLNCAVVGELIAAGSAVVDVGAGAGLPGIAVALARSDVAVTLVEPLLRRTRFLDEVVEVLGLEGQVRVVRGRAEDPSVRDGLGDIDIVLARALAPLDRVVRWCLPLLEPGGWLLALKGLSAPDELATHAAAVRRAGGAHADVVTCGQDIMDPPTVVVRVQRASGGRRAMTAR